MKQWVFPSRLRVVLCTAWGAAWMMGLVMPTVQALAKEGFSGAAVLVAGPASDSKGEDAAWEALQPGLLPWAEHVPGGTGWEGAADGAEEEKEQRERSDGFTLDAVELQVWGGSLGQEGAWGKYGSRPVRIEGRKWLFFSALKLDC
jgi:hypothetical protein